MIGLANDGHRSWAKLANRSKRVGIDNRERIATLEDDGPSNAPSTGQVANQILPAVQTLNLIITYQREAVRRIPGRRPVILARVLRRGIITRVVFGRGVSVGSVEEPVREPAAEVGNKRLVVSVAVVGPVVNRTEAGIEPESE